MHPSKIKFEKYHPGEWKHNRHAGVGLKLSGKPSDYNKFIDILQGESCNPVATRRILNALIEKNIYCTTVMAHLDFNYIGDALKEIDVEMKIIDPIPNPSDQKIDNIVFNMQFDKNVSIEKYSEKEKNEIINTAKFFEDNIKLIPHNFGAFNRN